MFQLYTGLLLSLFFTFLIAIDTDISLSRSIENVHETILDKKPNQLDQNNITNNHKKLSLKKSHERLFNERLKVIITISTISVGIMLFIVITCIVIQYIRNKKIKDSERVEQTIPLNTSKQTTHRPKTSSNKHNVSRKTKTLSNPPSLLYFM